MPQCVSLLRNIINMRVKFKWINSECSLLTVVLLIAPKRKFLIYVQQKYMQLLHYYLTQLNLVEKLKVTLTEVSHAQWLRLQATDKQSINHQS